MQSELETKVLYEIAMSIGNSTELDKALKEALTTMLRKLGGVRIAVFCRQTGEAIGMLPKRGFHADYIALGQQALQQVSHGHLLSEGRHEEDYFYLFNLPQTGALFFVTRHPLEEVVIKMLLPICQKLDNSIQACLAVDQLKQKEKDLQDSLVQLQLAQQSKDRFLANMSHEIRTPLNGILGFIQQISETHLDKEQAYYLDIIQNSSEMLMGIINDILDFSKIESGLLEINPYPFEFRTEVDPAVKLFVARAHEKSLNFIMECGALLNKPLLGDALRIKQVLSNLVSNAIKFTQEGSVKVCISLLSETDQQVQVRFEVKDSGIGIAKEKQSLIFDAFSQAEGRTTRDYGGTGLGLSISHKLVALMGGELVVDSELGKGSVFSFELTLQKAKDVQKKGMVTGSVKQDFSDKKLLLVEDNQVNQLLMKAIFKKLNLNFDLAENGQLALDAIEKQQDPPYDLIFMDINMPVMDGLQAMAIIQEKIKLGTMKALPVVALTANAMVGDKALYLEKGMVDTLTKPLKMDELLTVLNSYLG